MQWTREECSFCVEVYFSNSHSIIAVQHAFRLRFGVSPRRRVPGRQSIVNCVITFRTTGDVSFVRRGPEISITPPQNVERVRAAVLQSPKCSAQKQELALGISIRSLHRILHNELNFHPYKICVVQQLSVWDYVIRKTSCEDMLASIPRDANVFFSESKVYCNRPSTLEDLQNNIEAEIVRIPEDMLERVHGNFIKHLQ